MTSLLPGDPLSTIATIDSAVAIGPHRSSGGADFLIPHERRDLMSRKPANVDGALGVGDVAAVVDDAMDA